MAWSGATWIGGTFCIRRSENRPLEAGACKRPCAIGPGTMKKQPPAFFVNAGGFAESKLMPPCARQEKERTPHAGNQTAAGQHHCAGVQCGQPHCPLHRKGQSCLTCTRQTEEDSRALAFFKMCIRDRVFNICFHLKARISDILKPVKHPKAIRSEIL